MNDETARRFEDAADKCRSLMPLKVSYGDRPYGWTAVRALTNLRRRKDDFAAVYGLLVHLTPLVGEGAVSELAGKYGMAYTGNLLWTERDGVSVAYNPDVPPHGGFLMSTNRGKTSSGFTWDEFLDECAENWTFADLVRGLSNSIDGFAEAALGMAEKL